MQTRSVLATTPAPPQPPDKPKRTPQVRGKLQAAIDAMIWDGLSRADAAAKAGMTDNGLYSAFRKPHVKAYYLSALDVLRTSERARNIHALTEVRDQRDNHMARVQAVKALESIDDSPQAAGNRAVSPGIVIVVGNAPVPTHSGPTLEIPLNSDKT